MSDQDKNQGQDQAQGGYGYDRTGDGAGEAVQQGGDRANRERTTSNEYQDQGEKTREANREMTQSGSPDQGTH